MLKKTLDRPTQMSGYASLSPSRYQRKTRGRADRWSFLVRIFFLLCFMLVYPGAL
jgi:hypothetical protein